MQQHFERKNGHLYLMIMRIGTMTAYNMSSIAPPENSRHDPVNMADIETTVFVALIGYLIGFGLLLVELLCDPIKEALARSYQTRRSSIVHYNGS